MPRVGIQALGPVISGISKVKLIRDLASVSNASANQYSINLINEIFNRTEGRALMRVGGITG
jgi:hypothetical protein